MVKIGILIPYYGRFPNYFDLFLKSCAKNPTIDWIIVTDIKEEHQCPKNVRIIDMSFEKLKMLFQSKFDFEIALDNPYKLCDYKAMTGYLFDEYLKEYDYWGYSDIDMIFGDIRKFWPDEVISNYDKVGHLGHLTIYRNIPEVNTLFMKTIYGRKRYKEVLSSDDHFSFTEWYDINIHDIFVDQKRSIWFFNDFFDVEAYEENFKRVVLHVDYHNLKERKWLIEKFGTFASWENGRVYQWKWINGKWNKQEMAYVHFQKRKMAVEINVDTEEKFLCVPNVFIPYQETIPMKYIINSIKMGIVNRKHWKHWFAIKKYQVIEITGPIRHVFRKKNQIV